MPLKERFALCLCLGAALPACGAVGEPPLPQDTAAQHEESRERDLHEPPPAPLDLGWREVPRVSSAATLRAGAHTVSLVLGNRTGDALRVELRARIDDGTTESRLRPLGVLELAPRQQALRSIDLDALLPSARAADQAGLLRVTAVIRGSAVDKAEQAQAPALYLRSDLQAAALVVAGESAPSASGAEATLGGEPTVTERVVVWAPQAQQEARAAAEVRP